MSKTEGGRNTPKRPWVKPELKIISAGSAEADLRQDVKDGAGVNTKS